MIACAPVLPAAAAERRRIAIIGGGIAGLTCGWLLNPKNDITLFEKTHRIGGNAMTIDASDGNRFDMAVALYSSDGYHNFFRLMDRIGIETAHIRRSLVSMQDLDTRDGVYITPTLAGLIAQRFAIFKPDNVLSLVRLQHGLDQLQKMNAGGALAGKTLHDVLTEKPGISGPGLDLLLCALCLMSSQECEEVLDAPADFFVAKIGKYSDVMTPRALWSLKCIEGGSRRYVEALAEPFRDRIRLHADIATVERNGRNATVVMRDGSRHDFDEVILACNADQALALLAQPTHDEQRLLGAWRYRDGRVCVHRDHSSFPPRDLIQGYTFLYRRQGKAFDTSVSGAIWVLPGTDPDCPWISSQHPNFPIREDLIEFDTVLRTPIFEAASCAAQKELPKLNGVAHTWYCGSHFGYGLHEDAITSAINVSRALGAQF
jgi:predicted NAD/FAD-binding protein